MVIDPEVFLVIDSSFTEGHLLGVGTRWREFGGKPIVRASAFVIYPLKSWFCFLEEGTSSSRVC